MLVFCWLCRVAFSILFNYIGAIKVQCSSFLALYVSRGGGGTIWASGSFELHRCFWTVGLSALVVPPAAQVPVAALLIDLWRLDLC